MPRTSKTLPTAEQIWDMAGTKAPGNPSREARPAAKAPPALKQESGRDESDGDEPPATTASKTP